MPREVVNDMGTVAIADEVIATIAGIAATECYGVVGMASRRLRDGIAELLGRENLSKGVEISVRANQVAVNLNLIVGYGIRISEVAHNVSEQVKYRVEGTTGLEVVAVNMSVQGVRVADGR
ncbi:MAG TPA: Asp23/Gls24 family envelope stress response protein [Clostridiales bacterium]|nr:Asp23/Gls24 family envelope stress response protein [Clostridiales bacterium]